MCGDSASNKTFNLTQSDVYFFDFRYTASFCVEYRNHRAVTNRKYAVFNVFVDIHHYSEQINVSYVMLCYVMLSCDFMALTELAGNS